MILSPAVKNGDDLVAQSGGGGWRTASEQTPCGSTGEGEGEREEKGKRKRVVGGEERESGCGGGDGGGSWVAAVADPFGL